MDAHVTDAKIVDQKNKGHYKMFKKYEKSMYIKQHTTF
jgi:hypothetical protein